MSQNTTAMQRGAGGKTAGATDMTTQQNDALAQECADYATSLRSAANVAKLEGRALPVSFLRAADLFERAASRITELESQLAQRFDAADMATAAAQGFRDGVAAPQPAVAAGWRSIETAPKEGVFLVYMPDEARPARRVQVANWHPNVKVVGGLFSFDCAPITHWMPLPHPPTSAEGAEHGPQ